MSKLASRRTLDNTRFWLTYLDEKGDKITLSFRSEKSLNEHIKKHNIKKYSISNRPPEDKDLYPCASKIRSAIAAFENCYGSQGDFVGV